MLYVSILTFFTILAKLNLMNAMDDISINDYIVHPPEHNDTDAISSRSFFTNRLRWWPTSTIPYELAPGFTEIELETIFESIELNFHNLTCLRFVERTTEKDYITIVNNHSQLPADVYEDVKDYGDLCGWARERGETGGQVIMYLNTTFPGHNGTECVRPWVIIHELLHTLGFMHEHERVDSPCYLDLDPKGRRFKVGEYSGIDTSWPFDYKSIMLYSKFTLKHVKMDIVGLRNYKSTKLAMSEMDVQKINFLFCKKPHFCDLNRQACDNIDRWEQQEDCVEK